MTTSDKEPLTTDKIKLMVDSIGRLVLPIDVRDKAIILFGFAGAFRRSELVAIDFDHLDFRKDGVNVVIPRSKTDQDGEGRLVSIPYGLTSEYCPVLALKNWISCAGIKEGPVLLQVHKGGKIRRTRLGARTIALTLKKRYKPIGPVKDISGHSLRSGHVTSAIINGVKETLIMQQTGHKNSDTLRKYVDLDGNFKANSSAKLGI
ncbi:site-specific integrase [Chlamydiales bacterium]|nr:site-specific integrase [Chlamydiales bacterium]